MASEKEQDKLDYYEAESHVRFDGPIGGITTFNAEYGFLEAMIRGFRWGFLKESEYRQLCQCASLEDVKLTFGDTDMCNVLSNTTQLTPDIIQDRVWQKYVQEFQFVRNQAVGPLATFLDMITYESLISNISFLITGLIRGANPNALLAKCDPLGFFPRLKGVLTFDNNSKDGMVELYRTVLIDTPVAAYFEEFFDVELGRDEPLKEIERVYNEMEIDVITNRLQKFWLEDFYRYCKSLGGETCEMMKELLEFEADRRAISITLNSFKTPLSETHDMREKRRELFADLGKLYPEGLDSFRDVTNEDLLGEKLKPYPTYYKVYQSYKVSREFRSFPDALYAYEINLNRLAFDSQSHFACFWAYGRLKQQEKRNIWWIMSCIHEGRDPKEFGRWMKIF